MNSWPRVRLGEVLKRSDESIQPDPSAEYREITVRLWGNGVVERGRGLGGSVSGRRYVARSGQFIVSRIDARNGAMGLVPESLEGALVTNDFPLFDIVIHRLQPAYVGWLCRTAGFVELCLKASEGSTNRVRLKGEQFLSLEIPLPPLAEQRRVVDRIEELAAQIEEARRLRREAVEEGEALMISMAHRPDLGAADKEARGWARVKLGQVIKVGGDLHKVQPDQSYPNLGIYSYGRGLFAKSPIDGLATSAPALRRVSAGQFIYSRLFAFEGAYGRVTPDFDGAFVSQEYPTFDCEPRRICAEFLSSYFRSRTVWAAVAIGSKGLGDRRQRVQPAQILRHELWLPPMTWQRSLQAVQSQVDSLKRLQAETEEELEALLPAILDRAFRGEL